MLLGRDERYSLGVRSLFLLGVVLVACASPAATRDPDELPDPLALMDGRRVTTKDEWPERRAELLELFRSEVYGRVPAGPAQLSFTLLEEDPTAIEGLATLRRIAITSRHAGREHVFELLLFAPNRGVPSGVFLVINTRPPSHTDPTRAIKSDFWPAERVLARGYAIAAIQADEVAPDDEDTYASGVIRLLEGDTAPRPPDAWKTIGAWSWGASRALDYLVTDPQIDPTRIAVLGHSRGGKAALWAGAQDERFSLTISNQSGCAGAALSRRPVGETVELINLVFPHWFADNFRRYNRNEVALPIDQHELVALVAPRGVVVASASEDEWSDPEGEYLGLAYASSVYALWDFEPVAVAGMPAPNDAIYVEPRGYHLRAGEHGLTLFDWDRYLDVADRAWSP